MIRLHEIFATEDAAIEYREAMYRNYHPLGYGTHITIERKECRREDGTASVTWIAFGTRAESCD